MRGVILLQTSIFVTAQTDTGAIAAPDPMLTLKQNYAIAYFRRSTVKQSKAEANRTVIDTDNRIFLPHFAINGQAVRAILDTGTGNAAVLNERVAFRLGLHLTSTTRKVATDPIAGLYNSAALTNGASTITAEFAATTFDYVELVIGWPAVQENLLDINGYHRTINVLEEIPADLTRWVKLKIGPKSLGGLYVEIPLADGTVSTFLVDTGDPNGIALPEAQWKEWLMAHPNAPLADIINVGVVSTFSVSSSHADKLLLGPLTLINVPIRNLGDEGVEFVKKVPNFSGVIGLGALAQLELLIDNKTSIAYIRTISESVPAIRDNANTDWTIVGPVRLNRMAFNFTSAKFKLRNDDYSGAIADYIMVLDADPSNADAFEGRGAAKNAIGDFPGAIADYDRAIALNPNDAAAYINRGLIKNAKGDHEGAIADYDLGIILNPNSAEAYYNRGIAKQDKGDNDGAIKDYNRAIALNPKLAVAYNNRGYEKQVKGDNDEAILDYDRAIGLNPNYAVAYNNRGYAKQAKGDNDGAIADYNRVIALNRTDVFAYYNRGLSKQAKGDFSGALADCDKVISLDQKGPDEYLRFQRHLLLLRLGRVDDDLSPQVEGWKEGWPKTVGQFLTGKIDEKEMFRRAGDTKEPKVAREQACEANYYTGMVALLGGRQPEAREKFLACVATGVSNFIEFKQAKEELARLK